MMLQLITPVPGIVVKTKDVKGNKIFINLVMHDIVKMPVDVNMCEVSREHIDQLGLSNLRVPLDVSGERLAARRFLSVLVDLPGCCHRRVVQHVSCREVSCAPVIDLRYVDGIEQGDQRARAGSGQIHVLRLDLLFLSSIPSTCLLLPLCAGSLCRNFDTLEGDFRADLLPAGARVPGDQGRGGCAESCHRSLPPFVCLAAVTRAADRNNLKILKCNYKGGARPEAFPYVDGAWDKQQESNKPAARKKATGASEGLTGRGGGGGGGGGEGRREEEERVKRVLSRSFVIQPRPHQEGPAPPSLLAPAKVLQDNIAISEAIDSNEICAVSTTRKNQSSVRAPVPVPVVLVLVVVLVSF
eukprot:749375-Hanusia_phi.AAC.1